MVNVNELNVPPPIFGEAAIASLARDLFSGKDVKLFRARVLDGTPTGAGKVRVLVDGHATTARLRSTAKAVRTGDNVEVVKAGGIWHVVASDTWHEPPAVTAPPTTTPAAAATVSGSLPVSPDPVREPTSSTNAALYTTASRLAWWSDDMRYAFNQLASRVSSIQSVINTNASRLNSTRDVATGTRNTVTGVQSALGDEGIVR